MITTVETTPPPAVERFDAIVVGARAAGAATALLLARAGHRVLVVDRTERGSDTLSTHALLRAGVLQLSRWGLLDAVMASGAPPVTRVAFRYPGDDLVLPVQPTPAVPALVAPRRTVLDPILSDAALEAGADVRFGVRVEALVVDDGGRVVGIEAVDGEGRPVRARAPITVGADGARSAVARAVGAATRVAGRHTAGLAYGYVEGVDAVGYEWCWAPGRAAGLIPTNDDQVLVFSTVPSAAFRATFRADVEAGWRRVLREVRPDVADRVAEGRLVGRLRTHPGLVGHVRQPWGPGWALVGDAGYFKDPISAHGLSDALRDAELVAEAVASVVGGVPEADAMGRYDRLRTELSDELFAVTDAMASLSWTIPELQSLLLRLSAAMEPEVRHLGGVPAAA